MGNDDKQLIVVFFRTPTGHEPVRAWLKSLAPTDRLLLGTDLKTVEYGWPLGMPLCRNLGKGLWEVRSDLPHGRTARVLFCIVDTTMVLLHAFMKKTQKTPLSDVHLARQRMQELHHG